MARRFLTYLLLSLAVVNLVLLAPPRPAAADLIQTAPVQEVPTGSTVADRHAVELALASEGLSPCDVQSRMDQLAPDEVATLAHNPERVQMAGNSLIPLSIAACIVLVIVVLVWLETVNQKAKKEVQK